MRAPSLDDELDLALASDPVAMGEAPRIWRRLREEAPVHRHGPLLILSHHRVVRPILRDRERFVTGGNASSAQRALRASVPEAELAAFDELIEFQQLIMSRTPDVSRHDRLRRIAHRAFTPRSIAQARDSVVRYTNDLLDQRESDSVLDVAQLAYRLPLMVIADMLGVPHEDHAKVHHWCSALAPALATPSDVSAQLAAVHEFRGYLREVVARHRADPASVSPLVASMLDAEQGESLSLDELVAMFANLSFAGHETTANLISIGTVELLAQRGQWDLLCADPAGRAAAATEELLRYVTPVQFIPRTAAVEVELEGVTVEAGQTILLLLAGANRDPEAFTEPEALEIMRPDATEHVSFGFGPRYCLGVALARMEGEIVFRTLAERFPDMELETTDLEWHGVTMLRRLTSVLARTGV